MFYKVIFRFVFNRYHQIPTLSVNAILTDLPVVYFHHYGLIKSLWINQNILIALESRLESLNARTYMYACELSHHWFGLIIVSWIIRDNKLLWHLNQNRPFLKQHIRKCPQNFEPRCLLKNMRTELLWKQSFGNEGIEARTGTQDGGMPRKRFPH